VADRKRRRIITAAMTKALPNTTIMTKIVKTEMIVKIRKNPG
jgi:hypothetical protein